MRIPPDTQATSVITNALDSGSRDFWWNSKVARHFTKTDILRVITYVVPLINQLFKESQIPYIRQLWRDKNDDQESHKLIVRQIGRELEEQDKIILDNSLNQIVCILSNSSFANSEQEVIEVGTMIFYCLKKSDILPSLSDHRGKEFSSRALVSLALLEKAMDFLYQHRGAPKPEYYQNVAVVYLKRDNMVDVAEHFILWKNFLSEHLAY